MSGYDRESAEAEAREASERGIQAIHEVALRGLATDEALVEVVATTLRELRRARMMRRKARLAADCPDDLTGDAGVVLAAITPAIAAAIAAATSAEIFEALSARKP